MFPLPEWLFVLAADMQRLFMCSRLLAMLFPKQGADPANKMRRAISEIFGSQVSQRLRFCQRNVVCSTALLWQNSGRKNGLYSQILFCELYNIIVNKVTFAGFRGENRSNRSPWICPCPQGNMSLLVDCEWYVRLLYFVGWWPQHSDRFLSHLVPSSFLRWVV